MRGRCASGWERTLSHVASVLLLSLLFSFGGQGVATAEETPSPPTSSVGPTPASGPAQGDEPAPLTGTEPAAVEAQAVGASVSGVVTSSSSSPLAGAVVLAFEFVEVLDDDGGGWSDIEERGSATTAEDGSYTIEGLTAGRYYLKVTSAGFVSSWWPHARNYEAAELVILATDQEATGLDVVLEAAATITGSVSGSDDPLVGTWVEAQLWDQDCGCFDSVDSAVTDDRGEYSIGGLPSGTYTLRFEAPHGSDYVSEWWDDQRNEDLADTFQVTAGATVTGKIAQLALGARIAGTVTGTSGDPLDGVEVVPYLWDETAGQFDTVGGDAPTDADGNFTITGVPAGSYTLHFNSYDGNHASQWWNGKPDQSLADRFEVVVGDPTNGMDAQLAEGGSITGTVTGAKGQPLAGVDVGAFLMLPTGMTEVGSAETDGDGAYTITALPAGNYTLHFNPSDGIHASKWWSSGDVVLEEGTILSGRVTDTVGNAVVGADVCLFWRPSGDGGCGARTDGDGNYTWPGALDPDTYDMAVFVGGFESGTRYNAGPVTIEAGVESLVHDVVVDLNQQRRLSPGRSSVQAIADATDNSGGEEFAVAAGQVITGKNIQLAPDEPDPEITGPVPTIEGSAIVGRTLTARTGGWSPVAVTLTYQWFRGPTAIQDANSASYLPQAADIGSPLSVQVTGSKPGYESVTKSSAPTAKVAKGVLSPPAVTLSDTSPVVEQLIAAVPGVWGPTDVAFTYKWYRRSRAGKTYRISGATQKTYAVKASDRGFKLRVTVTGSLAGYTTVSRTSSWSSAVAKATFTTAPAPMVQGVPRVSMRLTANPGAWSPAAKFKYQWYRVSSTGSSKAISKATRSTYTPTSGDKGRRLKVRVRGYRSGFSTATRYSALTSPILPGMVGVTPKVSDSTPWVDQVLTAVEGTWAPSDVSFTYQWYAKSRAGKRYTISGATARTYQVAGKYAGYKLKVKVTGSKPDHASVSKTSAYTHAAAKAAFSTKPAPTITGAAQVGQTLTANENAWAPTPTSFKYQWYRTGRTVSGKTAKTYTLTSSDKGKTITVRVTAIRNGYTSATTTSVATGVVTSGPPDP